jgi:hypothetical protein
MEEYCLCCSTRTIDRSLQYLAPILAGNLIRGGAVNDDEHVED